MSLKAVKSSSLPHRRCCHPVHFQVLHLAILAESSMGLAAVSLTIKVTQHSLSRDRFHYLWQVFQGMIRKRQRQKWNLSPLLLKPLKKNQQKCQRLSIQLARVAEVLDQQLPHSHSSRHLKCPSLFTTAFIVAIWLLTLVRPSHSPQPYRFSPQVAMAKKFPFLLLLFSLFKLEVADFQLQRLPFQEGGL